MTQFATRVYISPKIPTKRELAGYIHRLDKAIKKEETRALKGTEEYEVLADRKQRAEDTYKLRLIKAEIEKLHDEL